jgi:hypothetical protein
MPRTEQLPRSVWFLPVVVAVAAIVAWAVWGDTANGVLTGAVLIGVSGLLVYAFALEVLPHRPGVAGTIRRWLAAIAIGIAAMAASFLTAGLGYYLIYRPFG